MASLSKYKPRPCRRCGGERPLNKRGYLCEKCPPYTMAESQRNYRNRHPERSAQNNRNNMREYRKNNPEKVRETALRSHHRDPLRKLITLARGRAKKKDWEFSVTEEDITIPTHCPVLGIPLFPGRDNGFNDNSPTLDRIDNSKGYVKNNVLVVSWRANRIKCDATVAELRKLADFYGSLDTTKTT